MSKTNPFEDMGEQLKKTEAEVERANAKKIKPLMIKIVSELENLSNIRAVNVPPGIINNIRESLDKIRNMPYNAIRETGDREIESRLARMNPKQAETFRKLWKDLSNEIFGKISEETLEGERPLTKAEKQAGFINSTAAEWARRIFDHYKNHEQLNFGALLSSMEREFGAMPSLPGQLERAESPKSVINALDELKKGIEEELGKIANQTQLEAIKKEGAIKKLEDNIELYKKAIRSGKIG
jgi:hypothetical protein